MSTFSYILFIILLIFTLFNLYALLTKKRRDRENERKYNAIFAPIDEKILKSGREWKGGKTQRIITEKEEGIVIVKDEKRERFIVASSAFLKEFKFSSLQNVNLIEDNEIAIEIKLEKEELKLTLSSSPLKKKSFIYQGLMSIAKESVEFLSTL